MKRIPVLGPLATRAYRKVRPPPPAPGFPGSGDYWEQRYASGGTSGAGSYNRLAEFKASVLNAFVREHGVQRVLELGCGDGAQLSLAEYPSYIGLDVARGAVERCAERFAGDSSKSFFVYDSRAFVDHHGLFSADLVLSLDVIYHLVEDAIFDAYMRRLFGASTRFVIIYSSNVERPQTFHERDREFTRWVAAHAPDFRLRERIPNLYPHDLERPEDTSKSDFYVFERVTPAAPASSHST